MTTIHKFAPAGADAYSIQKIHKTHSSTNKGPKKDVPGCDMHDEAAVMEMWKKMGAPLGVQIVLHGHTILDGRLT